MPRGVCSAYTRSVELSTDLAPSSWCVLAPLMTSWLHHVIEPHL